MIWMLLCGLFLHLWNWFFPLKTYSKNLSIFSLNSCFCYMNFWNLRNLGLNLGSEYRFFLKKEEGRTSGFLVVNFFITIVISKEDHFSKTRVVCYSFAFNRAPWNNLAIYLHSTPKQKPPFVTALQLEKLKYESEISSVRPQHQLGA